MVLVSFFANEDFFNASLSNWVEHRGTSKNVSSECALHRSILMGNHCFRQDLSLRYQCQPVKGLSVGPVMSKTCETRLWFLLYPQQLITFIEDKTPCLKQLALTMRVYYIKLDVHFLLPCHTFYIIETRKVGGVRLQAISEHYDEVGLLGFGVGFWGGFFDKLEEAAKQIFFRERLFTWLSSNWGRIAPGKENQSSSATGGKMTNLTPSNTFWTATRVLGKENEFDRHEEEEKGRMFFRLASQCL